MLIKILNENGDIEAVYYIENEMDLAVATNNFELNYEYINYGELK